MTGFQKRLRDGANASLRYRRQRIDVVTWIPECPFSDALVAEIAKAKPNSLTCRVVFKSGILCAIKSGILTWGDW